MVTTDYIGGQPVNLAAAQFNIEFGQADGMLGRLLRLLGLLHSVPYRATGGKEAGCRPVLKSSWP
jgi:hypothetical protein